jgi:hypothetical protein
MLRVCCRRPEHCRHSGRRRGVAPASRPLYYTRWTATQTDGDGSKMAQIVTIIMSVTVYITYTFKDADSVNQSVSECSDLLRYRRLQFDSRLEQAFSLSHHVHTRYERYIDNGDFIAVTRNSPSILATQ